MENSNSNVLHKSRQKGRTHYESLKTPLLPSSENVLEVVSLFGFLLLITQTKNKISEN